MFFFYDMLGVVIVKVCDECEEKGGFYWVDNWFLCKDGILFIVVVSS